MCQPTTSFGPAYKIFIGLPAFITDLIMIHLVAGIAPQLEEMEWWCWILFSFFLWTLLVSYSPPCWAVGLCALCLCCKILLITHTQTHTAGWNPGITWSSFSTLLFLLPFLTTQGIHGYISKHIHVAEYICHSCTQVDNRKPRRAGETKRSDVIRKPFVGPF